MVRFGGLQSLQNLLENTETCPQWQNNWVVAMAQQNKNDDNK
jgi:hypothetical protein